MWTYYIIVGVFVAGTCAMMFIANDRQRKRARSLAVTAERLGLSLHARERLPEPYREKSFRLRRPLIMRGTRNAITGCWRGLRVRVFDRVYFWWREELLWLFLSAESRCTLVTVGLDCELPRLVLRPRRWLLGLLYRLLDSGYVSSPPDLGQHYCVATDDVRFATDVLHPEMVELLRANPSFTIRLAGSTLTISRRRLLSAEEIEAALNLAADFYERMPGQLKKDQARS